MTKWTLRCVVLCGWIVAGAALQAHHSLAGVYALGKEAKVTGEFNTRGGMRSVIDAEYSAPSTPSSNR